VDRDQQSSPSGSTRTTPPKGQSKPPKAKPAASRAKGSRAAADTTAPDIMSRLPKSRPQRVNQRRRSTTAAAAKAGAQTTPAARKPATPKRPASTAPRRTATAAQTPKPAASSQRSAPGLPRLAVDGAAEAVKLPLKVGGRLTLRALDAVARGLRRQ
jgi:ABC-2 type transport system ATP-binding protein